ncbi:hypothetical protein GCM10009642_45590 [Nocardiopsis metallicus]
MGDLHLNNRPGGSRRVIAPQVADQLVEGDLSPGVHQEHAQHTTLAWSTDREGPSFGPRGNGAKHAEIHKEQP